MPKRKYTKHTKMNGKKGGVAVQHHMQQQNSTAMNPLLGAAIGAAVGGLMGAAAAVALSDKDTREKVKTAAGNLRDQAVDRLDDMKQKAQDVAEVTKEEAQKQLMGKKTHN